MEVSTVFDVLFLLMIAGFYPLGGTRFLLFVPPVK